MIDLIVTAFISLFTGYCILLLDKNLNDLERLAGSLGVSFLVYFPLSLIFHFLGLNILFSIASLIPILIVLIHKKVFFHLNIEKKIILIIIFGLLIRYLVQTFYQVPYSYDSYSHLLSGKSFLSEHWLATNTMTIDNWNCPNLPCQLEERPPFFGFVLGFFFNLFQFGFSIAKTVNTVVFVPLLASSYLLASRYSNKKVALFVSIFVAFSPFFLSQSADAEVRLISVYLIVTSLYFFLKGKNFWTYSMLFLALSYLTHYPEALILGISFLIYLLLNNRKEFFKISNIKFVILLIILVSPWLLRNFFLFENPFHSTSFRFVYLKSDFDYFLFERPTVGDYLSQPITSILYPKIYNIFRGLFPIPWKNGQLDFNILTNENIVARGLFFFATFPISFLALYLFVKKMKDRTIGRDLLFITFFISILFIFLTVSFPMAADQSFLFPQVITMLIVGFSFLEKLKKRYRDLFIVLIIISVLMQLPILLIKQIPRPEIPLDWILNNTEKNEVLMIRWINVDRMNYFTDRPTVAIPYGDFSQLTRFISDRNVSYLILEEFDFKLGDILNDPVFNLNKTPLEEKYKSFDHTTPQGNKYFILKTG